MLIYCCENLVNGRKYIGYAKDLSKRLIKHQSSAKKGSTYIFHKAIRKYGITAFKFKILEDNISNKNIDNREIYWIKKFHTWVGDPKCNGYNLTMGGQGFRGKHSAKSIQKMSGKNNHMFGKHHTQKHKQKISLALRGKKHSLEHNKKVSLSKIGIPRSEITKLKLSKKWLITFPDGSKKKIINLNAFCKKYRIADGNLRNVALGNRNHCQGYKCVQLKDK